MGYIIEITEDKVSHLADTIEKMLHYGGKAMDCIEEILPESDMGERRGSGNRDGGRYSSRGRKYQERDDDWSDEEDDFGERRGRSRSTGRYIRR